MDNIEILKTFLDAKFLSQVGKDVKNKSVGSLRGKEKEAAVKKLLKNDFLLSTWVESKLGGDVKLSFITHHPKYTHSSANTSSIFYEGQRVNDGLLRTGNVDNTGVDVMNTSNQDVAGFLNLKLKDGVRIYQHFVKDTATIRILLSGVKDYPSVRNKVLVSCMQPDNSKTSKLVKQVFFPVADERYHILSLLTSSPILSELKGRVDAYKSNYREHKDAMVAGEFYFVPNITVIGHGGKNSQNIGCLNNSGHNNGRNYLLMSLQPELKDRVIKLPVFNFFVDCLWVGIIKDELEYFHSILLDNRNNVETRNKLYRVIESITYKVFNVANSIRDLPGGWSNNNKHKRLIGWQIAWLDSESSEILNSMEFDKAVCISACAKWILNSYDQVLGKEKVVLGDEYLNLIIKHMNKLEVFK